MSVESGTPGIPAQGDTGGTPAATPAASPSGGAPAAQPGDGAAAAAAAAARQRFSYDEDRSQWVPPHRIRQQSERQQQLERELYFERQRVAALSGVQPPAAPQSQEERALRQQLEQLYPALGKLSPEKLDRLLQVAEQDPADMTQVQEHYWQSIGHQTLNRLEEAAAEQFGGELTPFAKQTLQSAFAAYVASDRSLGMRYAQQDPKLIKDFMQEYERGFLDPYRRKITTQAAPRAAAAARLPRGGSSSAVPGAGPAPIKPADTDEFHGAAFRALTQRG